MRLYHRFEVIAEGIPGARLVVVPAAAHLVNVEQPEAFNRAVLAHLLVAEPEPA
jgi:pimeloyl-ACP methyl ester carboxylesterase